MIDVGSALPRHLAFYRLQCAPMPLSVRHLVSCHDLTKHDVEMVLAEAGRMKVLLGKGGDDRLKTKVLASLFYEPSTRTRLSFETAMLRLGGQVVTAEGLQFSSMYKGETIEDTMRMAGQYADIICMRHPEQGSALRAASVSPVPFLNAGDGAGEHPTQALLDLYTILSERGRIDNITFAAVGDLKFGRTIHSGSLLLSLFPGVRFIFVSPQQLSLPEDIKAVLRKRGCQIQESESLQDALDSDVLYMTRVQSERFSDPAQYDRYKDAYILTADLLRECTATVMHPLPRNREIAVDVDALPTAAYFRQAGNAVPVRMALLALQLNAA